MFTIGNNYCFIRGSMSINTILSIANNMTVKQKSRLHKFDKDKIMEAYRLKLEAYYGRVYWPISDEGLTWLHKSMALAWLGSFYKYK